METSQKLSIAPPFTSHQPKLRMCSYLASREAGKCSLLSKQSRRRGGDITYYKRETRYWEIIVSGIPHLPFSFKFQISSVFTYFLPSCLCQRKGCLISLPRTCPFPSSRSPVFLTESPPASPNHLSPWLVSCSTQTHKSWMKPNLNLVPS